MSNKDIAQEWFRVADVDLSSAEFLRGMRPVPHEIICYHCQQAAEKYLKGFLAFQGEPIRKTHDLVLLNKLSAGFDPVFKTIENECLELTDYGVNVRYPFSIEVNEADMELAVKQAGQIREIVLHLCL